MKKAWALFWWMIEQNLCEALSHDWLWILWMIFFSSFFPQLCHRMSRPLMASQVAPGALSVSYTQCWVEQSHQLSSHMFRTHCEFVVKRYKKRVLYSLLCYVYTSFFNIGSIRVDKYFIGAFNNLLIILPWWWWSRCVCEESWGKPLEDTLFFSDRHEKHSVRCGGIIPHFVDVVVVWHLHELASTFIYI